MQTDKLWRAYSNTYFRWLESPKHWTRFAIITAFNPRGRLTPLSINHTRQSVFINRLTESGIEYRHIQAGNRDFSYFEPSLAVKTEFPYARLLSQELEQNAFFWIERDGLQLVPVLLEGYPVTPVGSFSSRVVGSDN